MKGRTLQPQAFPLTLSLSGEAARGGTLSPVLSREAEGVLRYPCRLRSVVTMSSSEKSPWIR